jgi:hypothetical protein
MGRTATREMERTEPMDLTPMARMARPTATEPTARTATEPTAPPDFPYLGKLVGQAGAASFGDTFLSRLPYRSRLAAGSGELFGWRQLNAALAEHRLAPPRLKLEKAGRDVTPGLFSARANRRGPALQDLDAGVLTQRLRDGATLIIDAVNELSPALGDLCSGLAAELRCACQANLYACWGTSQGFDVHWDDHDVFVLQIEGRKRWDLYGATDAAPARRAAAPSPEAPSNVLDSLTLTAGDLLYLPRGHWHAAIGLGEPSLHLTVGLNRKLGADFLHWLADESLSQALGRTDLPLEQDDTALGAQLAALLATLTDRAPEELARRYRRHVEAHQVFRPAPKLPFIGGAPPPDARLGLATGAARLAAAPTPDAIVLSWRGTEFTLAAALEAPLRELLAGRTWTLAQLQNTLPDLDPADLAALVAELAGRGVLVVGAESHA